MSFPPSADVEILRFAAMSIEIQSRVGKSDQSHINNCRKQTGRIQELSNPKCVWQPFLC